MYPEVFDSKNSPVKELFARKSNLYTWPNYIFNYVFIIIPCLLETVQNILFFTFFYSFDAPVNLLDERSDESVVQPDVMCFFLIIFFFSTV